MALIKDRRHLCLEPHLCDNENLEEFTCETIWAWCLMWARWLTTFSNSTIENGVYKLFTLIKWMIIICISLGNYPFGLGFQMYLHRNLQNSIFIFKKCLLFLPVHLILYICAFSFLFLQQVSNFVCYFELFCESFSKT